MTATSRDQSRPAGSLGDLRRTVVDELEQALSLPPLDLGQEVDQAERRIVRLRDALIEALRAQSSSPDAPRWRTALEQVNAALSLVAGVEYPAAGIQRKLLEQARDSLRRLQDSALPRTEVH